jgi:hypothetical protein
MAKTAKSVKKGYTTEQKKTTKASLVFSEN